MHTYGLTLKFCAHLGTLASLTANIVDVKGPSMEITMNEIKDISPTAATKVFDAGLIDEGELEFTLGVKKADITTLRAYKRVQLDYELAVPGTQGGKYTGCCWLQSIGNEFPYDEQAAITVKMKCDGVAVWTPAA